MKYHVMTVQIGRVVSVIRLIHKKEGEPLQYYIDECPNKTKQYRRMNLLLFKNHQVLVNNWQESAHTIGLQLNT